MGGRSELIANKAKELLESGKAQVIVGYGCGANPAAAKALFVREAGQAADLIFDESCGQNLTKYLVNLEEKAAIIVKGCDSRSLVSLIQDNELSRDEIYIIGIPCDGMIDPQKVKKQLGIPLSEVTEMRRDGEDVVLIANGTENRVKFAEVRFDRCTACKFPNPVIGDELIGEKAESSPVRLPGLEDIDKMTLSERRRFWQDVLSACIRCYACRNACPVCVCQDACIVQNRVPHWMSSKTDDREKLFFQMTRAMHVAGRCTGCGECERACPMNIPLNLINQKMVEIMEDLFDYEPGTDIEAPLPLSTYRPEDPEAK